MQRRCSLSALVFAVSLGLGAAQAQSLSNSTGPAEYPPSSYTGKQYIDSKGCVYVRAGFDGAVTWVPRVSRKRTQLCGFKPSLSGSEPVMAAAAPPKPAPVAAPPRVVAKPVRTPAAPVRTYASAPTRSPTQVRIQTTPPAPLVRHPAPARQTASPCAGASALSQRYLVTDSGYPVRCGPQANSAGSGWGTNTGQTYASLPPPPKIAPPPGYRAAFDDGRFNPNRGKQTREGHAQMRLIWTSGVPRRLVEQGTGRDVTRLFPRLRWPFLSMHQQNQYMANKGTKFVYATSEAAPAATSTTRYSTKSVAPVRATPAPARVQPAPVRAMAVPAGHRYVQVGTFGQPANAQNTARRLQAMGLPVRVGNYTKAGKVYRIVMAGPFASPSQLQAGLAAARRAGFGDAFTRK